jgi:hypothetical protein
MIPVSYHGIVLRSKDSVVGFEVLTAVVMKSSVFWDITPCSLLKVNELLGGTSPSSGLNNKPIKKQQLDNCFTHVSCFAYSYTLKMEVTCSSKTSVNFQCTT